LLAGFGVARHHACAQAQHGDRRLVRGFARQELEELPERARGVVVRDGRGGLGAEELGAMVGVANDERVVRVLGPLVA
jgi:hypothetical protein